MRKEGEQNDEKVLNRMRNASTEGLLYSEEEQNATG